MLPDALKNQYYRNGFKWKERYESGSYFKNWKLYEEIDDELKILYQKVNQEVKFSAFYHMTFRFFKTRGKTNREKFNLQYRNLKAVPTTAEKLKYLRYQNQLKQEEVADYINLARKNYIQYENVDKPGICPKETLKKLSELYQIPLVHIYDEYYSFIYQDAGRNIKNFRKEKGLTQKAFANYLSVSCSTVKKWEKEISYMSKENYYKLKMITKEV